MRKEDDLGLKLKTILFAAVRMKLKGLSINSYRQAYFLLLQGCLADGMLNQIEKKFLRDYRTANNVTLEEHTKFLEDLGWTSEDYQRGFKSVEESSPVPVVKSALHDTYDRLLSAYVETGTVNDIEKSVLIMYRHDNHIEPEYHEEALRKVGWTKKEFDRGRKTPSINFGNIILDKINKS